MRLLAVALALLGASCLGPVPDELAISPGFTALQRVAIEDAARVWCEVKGECFEIVPWGTDEAPSFRVDDGAAEIRTDTRYSRHGRPESSCGFTSDPPGGWVATMNMQRPECYENTTIFWRAVAHELGHLRGIEHHGSGIMAEHPWDIGPTDGSDM